MAFSFRLESILHWKKNLEELAQKRLADLRRELQKKEEEIQDRILQRITRTQELMEKSTQGMGAAEYLTYQQFLERGHDELRSLEEEKRKLSRDVEEARQRLLALTQEKKILEKLKERRFRRYNQQLEQKVQVANDEWTIQRYGSGPKKFPPR